MKYKYKVEVEYIKNSGDVLACRYYHQSFFIDGVDAIGDCGSKDVDGKKWDIFHVKYETEEAYYGVPMLGMGLMNCMILKSDTRPFLEEEKNGYNVGMFGSNSSNFVRDYDIEIEPIISKM